MAFKLPRTNPCSQRGVPVKDKTSIGQSNQCNTDAVFGKGRVQDLWDGLYIRGQGTRHLHCTGASRTIISSRVYDKMKEKSRPVLKRLSTLREAGGSPIKERGKAAFQFTLGPLEFVRQAIVTEIENEVLLGYNILAKEGPADILLSKNIIKLGGKEIPCLPKSRTQTPRRVVLADDVAVPGQSEVVVDVYVERLSSNDQEVGHFLVEASDSFQDRQSLRLASTLVDLNQGPTCKVRVLNPFLNEVKLWQDSENWESKENQKGCECSPCS